MKKVVKRVKNNKTVAMIAVIGIVGIATGSLISNQHQDINNSLEVIGASTVGSGYTLKVNKTKALEQKEVHGKRKINSATSPITINATLINNSGGVLSFAPGMQLFVTDQLGLNYYMTSVFKEGIVFGGNIANNAAYSADYDFILPSGSIASSINFQKDSGTIPITVKLN